MSNTDLSKIRVFRSGHANNHTGILFMYCSIFDSRHDMSIFSLTKYIKYLNSVPYTYRLPLYSILAGCPRTGIIALSFTPEKHNPRSVVAHAHFKASDACLVFI